MTWPIICLALGAAAVMSLLGGNIPAAIAFGVAGILAAGKPLLRSGDRS